MERAIQQLEKLKSFKLGGNNIRKMFSNTYKSLILNVIDSNTDTIFLEQDNTTKLSIRFVSITEELSTEYDFKSHLFEFPLYDS
jgi:hypothetical protein